jgi:hypothetical protein
LSSPPTPRAGLRYFFSDFRMKNSEARSSYLPLFFDFQVLSCLHVLLMMKWKISLRV